MQRSWSFQSKSIPRLAPLTSAVTLLRGPGQSADRDPFGQTALKRSVIHPNAAPYYRCVFATEYGLANHVQHPRNVTLRQDAILGPLDKWLFRKFDARYLAQTIDELTTAAKLPPAPVDGPNGKAAARIADCDRKLAGYRAALDAGGDPAVVSRWINETTAERARLAARTRPVTPRAPMTGEQIAFIVTALDDILAVLRDADPADKAEIYSQLGLRLTYQPGQRIVRAEAHLDQTPHWVFDSVRGWT